MKKTVHELATAEAPKVDPLAEYEARARIYCQFKGRDADAPVKVQDAAGNVAAVRQWRIEAARIRDFHIILGLLVADVKVETLAPPDADDNSHSDLDVDPLAGQGLPVSGLVIGK